MVAGEGVEPPTPGL